MLHAIKQFLHNALALPPVVATTPIPDWTALYRRLDARYGLAQRGVNLYLFLRDPELHEYWITFFFANPALFEYRVGLHFFLNHDPEHIVNVLRANQRKPVVAELLCRSQVERTGDSASALIQPRRCKPLRDVVFRGGRFIQPVMRHRIKPRFKARG